MSNPKQKVGLLPSCLNFSAKKISVNESSVTKAIISPSISATPSNKIEIYLDYIVSNLPHYIFWKDANSIFLGCNKMFAAAVGFISPQEIIGKSDYDMPWKKEESAAFIADDKAVMDSGEVKLNYEELQSQANGTEKIMLVSKVPMYDKNHCIIGVLGIYTDITERKQMEKELRHSKEVAEIANRLKSDFIHNMEHDIRTPFNGIWSIANLLEEKETDLYKKELLGDISKCAKELLDYCNNILDIVKTEAGLSPVLAKKFNLKILCERIIILETPPAKSKNLQLLLDFPAETPEIVIGDKRRIEYILINLTSNAVKFTQHGHIKISAQLVKKGEHNLVIRLMIEDTGIGIPKDKQEFIYERFTRGTPANKGIYKGLGLGLGVVKQLIEEIEGEIDVKSELGKGTSFICTIPFKLPLVDEILNKDDEQ